MAENEKPDETPEADEAAMSEPVAETEAAAEPIAAVEEVGDPAPAEAEQPAADEAKVAEAEVAEAEVEPAEAEVAEPEPVVEQPEDSAAAEPQPVAEEPAPEPVAEASPGAEPAPKAEASQEERKKKKRLPRALRRQRTKPARERPATRKPIVRGTRADEERERGRRQERRGIVVSNAMEKTIVVKVDTIKAHPKYGKVVRRSAKFHAHDEQNRANVGDVVRIVETRPLSKQKRWRLAEIVEAAK